MKLFDGAAVLLANARHDRDFVWCGQVGRHYEIGGYKYAEDGSPLPQLPRAPQIVDVQDLGYAFSRGVA